jgi:hypothetical protein
MLLSFHLGENCPCPVEIREDLYDFHEDLLLHCGEQQGPWLQRGVTPFILRQPGGWESLLGVTLLHQLFKE